MKFQLTPKSRPFVHAILCVALASPVQAYKWPGDSAGLGGAIAAKAIGEQCQAVLTAPEIGELETYIAKATAEIAATATGQKTSADGTPFHAELTRALTDTYTKKYAGPAACDHDATEEARDMLQRVRRELATGRPLFAGATDPDRAPDVGEAITAKVTAEKCRGALNALGQAELEVFIAKSWLSWAQITSDADARASMESYKTAARDLFDGWGARDCTLDAVVKAKRIAAHVHDALAERPSIRMPSD